MTPSRERDVRIKEAMAARSGFASRYLRRRSTAVSVNQ